MTRIYFFIILFVFTFLIIGIVIEGRAFDKLQQRNFELEQYFQSLQNGQS